MNDFVEGACRNAPNATRSHLYQYGKDGELAPMCGHGWNRSNGHAFSILRGWKSKRGTCSVCEKNIHENKPPVIDGWEHKTKWL